MNHIYAPWRTEYISQKSTECVFCDIAKNPKNDEQNFVFYRDEHCFGVMNLYPYTPGHFMFIPCFHTDKLQELDPKVWQNISLLAQKGVRLLQEGFKASGVNMGMNLGDAAGAGISCHIHLHLVPRFFKDTNFITSIAQTRVYPTDFHDIYEKIKKLSKVYLK